MQFRNKRTSAVQKTEEFLWLDANLFGLNWPLQDFPYTVVFESMNQRALLLGISLTVCFCTTSDAQLFDSPRSWPTIFGNQRLGPPVVRPLESVMRPPLTSLRAQSRQAALPRTATPTYYPYVIARPEDRVWIRSTPIEMRPNRPFHFYGNRVRQTIRR